MSNTLQFLEKNIADKELKTKYTDLFTKETQYKNRFIYCLLKRFDLFLSFLENSSDNYIKENSIESLRIDFINFVFLKTKFTINTESLFEDFLKEQKFVEINNVGENQEFSYKNIKVSKVTDDCNVDYNPDDNYSEYTYSIFFYESENHRVDYENICSFEEFCYVIKTLKTIIDN